MTHEELCRMEQSKLIKLIDKGRLAYLPCIPDDDIYWIDTDTGEIKIHKNGVKGVCICGDEISILDKDGGIVKYPSYPYCFLSREEAEKALKEREVNGK